MDPGTGTDELIFGAILVVAGVLMLIFRRPWTRVSVRFYGHWAEAMPWAYPGPLRAMTREPFIRWMVIASGLLFLAIGIGFILFSVFVA